MQISGKVVIVTGAASGIGRALALRFRAEDARGVVLADRQAAPLRKLAREMQAHAVVCDAGREADVARLVEEAERIYGPVDVFCSNAGVLAEGGVEAPDALWAESWRVHLMAHVYAARAVAEKMASRGSGYLVNTSSAAGLLTHVDSAVYSVTKHAAVALAEWLAIRYGDRGVRVSVLCPQAVRTAMTAGREGDVAALDGMLEPEQVASAVIEAMAHETFLILPHPQVLDYLRRKSADYDRWIAGMRRLRRHYHDGS